MPVEYAVSDLPHFSDSYIIRKPKNAIIWTKLWTSLKIPAYIQRQLWELVVPSSRIKVFRDQFHLIQHHTDFRYRSLSFVDFLIAYLGAEHIWPVVSGDRDVLEYAQEFLDFIAVLPVEVLHLPSDSLILLDSNILLTFSGSNPSFQETVREMFLHSPSITFLVATPVFAEIQRVHQRTSFSTKDQKEIHGIPGEAQLEQFIDNFEGFSSYHATRKKSNQKTRSSKKRKRPNFSTRKY